MNYDERVGGKPSALLPCAALILAVLCSPVGVHAAEKRLIVQGVSHANLRSGPGVSYPPTIILRENDRLTIEAHHGEWYLVATMEGQKGYVHQSVVRVLGEGQTPTASQQAAAAKSTGTETSTRTSSGLSDAPSMPARVTPKTSAQPAPKTKSPTMSSPRPLHEPGPSIAERKDSRTPQAKTPPLIRLIEGRESDLMLWLAIAVAFFFIGWICGGNYYVRRDRLRRRKLRF